MPRSGRCRETDSYKKINLISMLAFLKWRKWRKVQKFEVRGTLFPVKQWEKYLAAQIGGLECPAIAPSISAIFGFTFSNQVLTPYYYRAHWFKSVTVVSTHIEIFYHISHLDMFTTIVTRWKSGFASQALKDWRKIDKRKLNISVTKNN